MKKTLLVNIMILLSYVTLLGLGYGFYTRGFPPRGENYASLGTALLTVLLIFVHLFCNLVLSFIFFYLKDKEKGKAYLLSIAVIAIIGVPACFGGTFLTDWIQRF